MRGAKKLQRLNLPFKLSNQYLIINRHSPNAYGMSDRRGIVLYETRDGCYAVIFNGTKTIRVFHKRFIDILPPTN